MTLKISESELLKQVANLECVERIKVTVDSALKYGVLVGGATVVSGILGGPVGLALGGAISSCVAGYVSQGKFESASYILLYRTTPEQRVKLAQEILKFFFLNNMKTVGQFVNAIRNNPQLTKAIIEIIILFLTTQLGINKNMIRQ